MPFERWPARLALAAALLAALSLTACGRKGGLDLPPGATLAEPAPAAAPVSPPGGSLFPGAPAAGPTAQNGFDAHGNPVAPPGAHSGFLLDPLLN